MIGLGFLVAVVASLFIFVLALRRPPPGLEGDPILVRLFALFIAVIVFFSVIYLLSAARTGAGVSVGINIRGTVAPETFSLAAAIFAFIISAGIVFVIVERATGRKDVALAIALISGIAFFGMVYSFFTEHITIPYPPEGAKEVAERAWSLKKIVGVGGGLIVVVLVVFLLIKRVPIGRGPGRKEISQRTKEETKKVTKFFPSLFKNMFPEILPFKVSNKKFFGGIAVALTTIPPPARGNLRCNPDKILSSVCSLASGGDVSPQDIEKAIVERRKKISPIYAIFYPWYLKEKDNLDTIINSDPIEAVKEMLTAASHIGKLLGEEKEGGTKTKIKEAASRISLSIGKGHKYDICENEAGILSLIALKKVAGEKIKDYIWKSMILYYIYVIREIIEGKAHTRRGKKVTKLASAEPNEIAKEIDRTVLDEIFKIAGEGKNVTIRATPEDIDFVKKLIEDFVGKDLKIKEVKVSYPLTELLYSVKTFLDRNKKMIVSKHKTYTLRPLYLGAIRFLSQIKKYWDVWGEKTWNTLSDRLESAGVDLENNVIEFYNRTICMPLKELEEILKLNLGSVIRSKFKELIISRIKKISNKGEITLRDVVTSLLAALSDDPSGSIDDHEKEIRDAIADVKSKVFEGDKFASELESLCESMMLGVERLKSTLASLHCLGKIDIFIDEDKKDSSVVVVATNIFTLPSLRILSSDQRRDILKSIRDYVYKTSRGILAVGAGKSVSPSTVDEIRKCLPSLRGLGKEDKVKRIVSILKKEYGSEENFPLILLAVPLSS